MAITPAQQVGGSSWKVAEGPVHPLPKVRLLPGPEAPRFWHLGGGRGPRSLWGFNSGYGYTPEHRSGSLPWRTGIVRRRCWRLGGAELGVEGGGRKRRGKLPALGGNLGFLSSLGVNAVDQMLHRLPPGGSREYCREEEGELEGSLCPSFCFSSVAKVPPNPALTLRASSP